VAAGALVLDLDPRPVRDVARHPGDVAVVEADAAVRGRRADGLREISAGVHRDDAVAAVEVLEPLRERRGRERPAALRPALVQAHAVDDVEVSGRRGRARRPDDDAEALRQLAPAVDARGPRGEVDDDPVRNPYARGRPARDPGVDALRPADDADLEPLA